MSLLAAGGEKKDGVAYADPARFMALPCEEKVRIVADMLNVSLK